MDYKARQDFLEADYEAKYSEWIESLSESELKELIAIDPTLTESHIEKPSYLPDYGFMNNTERDESQDKFIDGSLFDESEEDVESDELAERVLLRETIVSMVMNLESADDTGFAIGIACVALGVTNTNGEKFERELSEKYNKSVKLILDLAQHFLEDTNIASLSDRNALTSLVAQLAQTGNPALSLDVLKIATRIASCGDSQSEVARRHNISRQAVHKRRKRIISALGLRG